jgi:long-subunit fatty acid transport protein
MRRLAFTGLVLAAVAWASESSAQTAALSLSIPPTGRANGMGQAYVAIADDASATWWNPAGLAFLPKKEASLTYAKLVPGLADDVFIMFPAYTAPIKTWGTFGASIVYLSYGTSQATSPTGEDLGTFTSYEMAPTLSYGTKIGADLGLGASFKYVRVQLSPDLPGLPGAGKGSTVAFDIGALYKIPGNMVNIGLAIQNMGPSISFIADDRSDPIYRNAKFGVAVNAYSKKEFAAVVTGDINQLLVQGEITQPDGSIDKRYQKPIYNFGGEVAYNSEVALALRGGYVYDKDGSIQDPTYGFGIGYKSFDIDFASIPQAKDPDTGQRLDRVSKFSLAAHF